MHTQENDGSNCASKDHRYNNYNGQAQLIQDCPMIGEDNLDSVQSNLHQARNNKRIQVDDASPSKDAAHTPKRRNTEKTNGLSGNPSNRSGTLQGISSYFNYNQNLNKHSYDSSSHKQTYESDIRNQRKRDSFPPFQIKIKDDMYPAQDVTIIRDMNRKCKLSLTYGRMSSSKNNPCYLIYCNTTAQFEYLLDKANWPDKICDMEYTIEISRRIPSSYSVVMLNIPTKWDVQYFCNELKTQYKTIIRCERLYVKGERPIPKIRIDFSSNKELVEILKSKRMLLDEGNTAYPIEQYVPPARVLRCYICQQLDDHMAARCPNKDKPICFKCGQQHTYDPVCQNKICCAHCKGDHMAGSPNCPKKIESRELKKVQTKQSALVASQTTTSNNRWINNSVSHLFDSTSTDKTNSTSSNTNSKDFQSKILEKMHLDILNILKQQVELNTNLKQLTLQLNKHAMDIININRTLNEIVCPLLKEVTQIIYTKISSEEKRQMDSTYNKLVNYLNQKEVTDIASRFQNQVIDKNESVYANDEHRQLNNESNC
ncbi:unnamed protein product [Adineta steineri]|uniref:Gag-like protein n=1 Tax=Adineta steineri TaxID=433720 RepID=A0A819TT98_9BILA|nr:unnamed protein product [Adineta steineri]CAF4083134.1 unnamed protein product [Adineta steineri]